MNEKTTTPIEAMANLLAEMTERAIEAENERVAAREDAQQWYQNYLRKDAQLSEIKAELEAQRKENEELRSTISEYIETMQKGAQENGQGK